MQALIVPVDFSSVSDNALQYAAHLAPQLNCHQLILYHSMINEFADQDVANHKSELALQAKELKIQFPHLEIIPEANTGFMLENIERIIKERQVLLTVMGITGRNRLEQTIIGSNTLAIAQGSTRPVIVVPANARYQKIENVAMGIDYNPYLLAQIPVKKVNDVLSRLDGSLHLLNILSPSDKINPDSAYDRISLAQNFFGFNDVQTHFIEGGHSIEQVETYCRKHDVQMLISILKEYNWFDRIFKNRQTRKLVFHTDLPIMVCKGERKI